MQDLTLKANGVAVAGNNLSVTTANGIQNTTGLVANGVCGGNNLTVSTLIARSSVLKFCDHRHYLTVETHLPILKGLKVIDGEEKTESSLIRVPFDNKATTTIHCEDGRVEDDIQLTTKCYVGRVNFIHKTEPIRQWTTLTSSYEQRIFRFQLYCIYNVFANGVFTHTRMDVPFDTLGDWNMTLRFVNKL